jgi:hypothetical protein
MVRHAFALALAVFAVPALAARDGITEVGFDEDWYARGSQTSSGTMTRTTEGVGSVAPAEGNELRTAHDRMGGPEYQRAAAPAPRDPADLQPDFGG